MFLIPYSLPEEMRVGESYALAFAVSVQKPPDAEAIRLFPDQSYLQIEGIDSSWTSQELIQRITGDNIIINIRPPADLSAASVELHAKVTIGELGSTLGDLYKKTIPI